MKTVSVLVITAAPANTRSAAALSQLVRQIDSRAGARAELWYLRCDQRPNAANPDRGARNVDDLRRWWPAATLTALGSRRLAGWLRGWRLRSWFRSLSPDVVVLDDGLGGRLLTSYRRKPAVVVRLNRCPSSQRELEPPPAESADLVLVPMGFSPPSWVHSHMGTRVIVENPPLEASSFSSAEAGATLARQSLGLPERAPLMVGWGDDGWLNGPEVFVRILWAVRRVRPEVHGVWIGLSSDHHEADRICVEASRVGVGDHFHLRPDASIGDRVCGDVAVLPYRVTRPDLEEEVSTSLLHGAALVAFPVIEFNDPMVDFVPYLDVEAAAAAVLNRLETDVAIRRSYRQSMAADVVGELVELARTSA